jgi:hypothetical protein
MESRFAFGENWKRFVRGAGAGALRGAEEGLRRFLPDAEFAGRLVLDAGCGTGLH